MRTKTLSFILASTFTVLIALAGVGLVAANMHKTVLLDVMNDKNEMVKAEFILAPKKIACLNYDSIDILDRLGMGDRIVGMVKGAHTPAHLKKYNDNPKIVDLGGMKNPNMQALAALKPEVILSSGRTAKMYADFTKIAPTMTVHVQAQDGFLKGMKDVVIKHGMLMGKEQEVQRLLAELDKKVIAIKQKNTGKKAIQAIFVRENLHILGGKGASGKGGGKVLIADLGFDNMAENYDRTHKDVTAYEYIAAQNPEFIFVLDKNVAVGSSHAKAKDVLPKNEKLMQTEAVKQGKLVFLNPENTWYVNSGGLTAMEQMLKNF